MGTVRVPLLLLALATTTACGPGGGDGGAAVEVPSFPEPHLQQGRSIWMQVCRNCHLAGVAGAPAVDDQGAWRARRAKGTEALYRSAIEGIPGDGDWAMPPKGGNDKLTEAQVRHAVDFILAAVEALAGGQTP